MNIEDVKQIPIADYLHSLGYSPVKRQGNGLWYKSAQLQISVAYFCSIGLYFLV